MKNGLTNLKLETKASTRQPVHMILYIFFLALLSFGFLSHVLEYMMMRQQIEQAASYYRPVGRVSAVSDPKVGDISEAAGLIEESDEILYSSRNVVTFGALSDLYTPNILTAFGDYWANNTCYFYGSLVSKSHNTLEYPITLHDNLEQTYTEEYSFHVKVTEIHCALPEFMQVGDTVRLLLYSNDEVEMEQLFEQMELNETYLYGTMAKQTTQQTIGSINYAFYMGLGSAEQKFYYCKPDFSDVTENQREWIEDDMERQFINTRGLSICSISDVAFSEVALDLYRLREGRWINQSDEEKGRRVCVVHQNMAELRGVEIGDEISIDLYDVMTGISDGALLPALIGQEKYDNWREIETVSQTYTVVGIFGFKGNTMMGASMVFVPPSSIPQAWTEQWKGNYLGSNYFYFVLESPDRIETFLAEHELELSEMGYTVRFEDHGWAKFQESAEPMLQTSLTSSIIYGVLMVCTIVLLAVLAVLSKRKELAIMRALGVTACAAGVNGFVPLFMVGTLGIIAGAGIAWFYLRKEAAELLRGLTNMIAVEAELHIPTGYYMLIVGCVVFLWAVIILSLLIYQLQKPVLVQLQGGQETGRQTQKTLLSEEKHSGIHRAEKNSEFKATGHSVLVSSGNEYRGKIRFQMQMRLICYYSIRIRWRTALTILITSGFLVMIPAINFFLQYNEKQIDYLYHTVEITGDVQQKSSIQSGYDVGVVPVSVVEELKRKETLKSLYLEMETTAILYDIEPILNQIPKVTLVEYLTVHGLDKWQGSNLEQSGMEIEYLPGFDETFLTSKDINANGWIVMNSAVMAQYGLDLDDEIYLRYLNHTKDCFYRYRIIGRITADHGSNIDIIIRSKEMEGQEKAGYIDVCYSTVKFSLYRSVNKELEFFQKEMEELLSTVEATRITELVCTLNDDELTMAVEPLEQGNRLMEILYPILLVISVLVSAGVAILLMLPRRKEAAIMRVLGTRKRYTVMVFAGGHMLACMVGILVALFGMWYMASWLYKWVWSSLLICIGLYLLGSLVGSFIGAWTLVSGKPLELLQVKE